MALGLLDESSVTAAGIMGSLRCGNPNCNNIVAQAHLMGVGVFRVLGCAKCGRGSEYENTPRGWTVRLLPNRAQR
jgi:hypothetical protein